ncbi:MAG TPA: DUF2004 domain-containing protein [Chitinophagales bacterium]|nr:DUF2004 domain-containing protein [Chitinophagales bacterium]
MNQQKLSFFGDIDLDQVKSEYISNLKFEESNIALNLNIFENDTVTPEIIEKADVFLKAIEDTIRRVYKYLLDDYESEGETYGYIQHHIDNLEPEEIINILGKHTPDVDQNDDLVGKLKLNRIAVFPEDDDEFAVFDFTIGRDYTDYVMAIYTDRDGNLIDLGIES